MLYSQPDDDLARSKLLAVLIFYKICCVRSSFVYFFLYGTTHNGMRNLKIMELGSNSKEQTDTFCGIWKHDRTDKDA